MLFFIFRKTRIVLLKTIVDRLLVSKYVSSYLKINLGIRYSYHWHLYVQNDVVLANAIKIAKTLVKNSLDVKLTATGVMQIFYQQFISMIPCSESASLSLSKNYSNYLNLCKSSYSSLVAYKTVKYKARHVDYYQMDKLCLLEDSCHAVQFVIDEFKKYSKVLKIASYDDITYAKEIIKHYIGFDIEKFKVYADMSAVLCEFGPIHGDLTATNVMKNTQGQTVIIDLDRFSFSAPQFIDCLHFIINEKEKKYRKSWLILIKKHISGADKMSLPDNLNVDIYLFIYTIFRSSFEIKLDIQPVFEYIMRLKKLLITFKAIV